ncbi:MAG: sigma-70 family RNA polymerase sigma factor [Ferruginibacter sp.]
MTKEKFIHILNDNKWILYKVINIYCKDLEDRKDLEQEILIQLWKSLESYNNQYKISTWIYKVAMNVSISFYRSNLKRKSRTSPISESIINLSNQEDNPMPLDEERKILYDFINQLDEFNQEILILYLDNHSYKEIAEIVGITESNVGTKINRIKNKLQEYYTKLNKINYGIK